MSTDLIRRGVVEFGPFSYDPERRELRDANGPVRIGSRALQLLDVLLESPGRLHDRNELMSRVWPQAEVEETSLRTHMSALRRALGEGRGEAPSAVQYITNVPGRGYAFVGEVQATGRGREPTAAPPPPAGPRLIPRLPAPATRLFGREQTVERIGQLSLRERLVSVVGAGGMGKTSVALAVAAQARPGFADGTFFIDLSRLSDPSLVVVELGQAFGLTLTRGEPLSVLEAALRGRQALILLDNCEHVIDAVAAMVEGLLRTCPQVHLLATSREPLEIGGEWVFKLPPLGLPEPGAVLALDDVRAYPAIQLFVERASATSDAFELTESNAPAVRQLCEFLDGIPLAIELAAARVDSLGVQGLLQRLESAFDLLTRGRRAALNRHRTLHAVMEWSYELLSADEKLVLQRLSVFRASFDLDSAITVAASAELPRQRVIEALLGLCAKSLAVLEGGKGSLQRHRLLYITRLFAQQQLDATDDANAVRGRHARLVLDKLHAMQRASMAILHYRWTREMSAPLADLRAAIDWGMTQEHDLALGLDVVAQSVRIYFDAGLLQEYTGHVAVALSKLERAGVMGTSIELKLRQGQACVSGNVSRGSDGQESLFDRVRELVQRVGTVEDHVETLYCQCVGGYGQGKYHFSLARCEEIRALARGPLEPVSVIVADRVSALNLHMLGEHDEAERLARRVMAFQGPRIDRRYFSEVPFGVSMRIQIARIEFLRGRFTQAMTTVHEALACAADAHVFSLGQALAVAAVPIAFWRGDVDMVRQWTTELREHCRRHGLCYLDGYGRMSEALLAGEMNPPAGGDLQMLEQCVPLADLFDTLRPGHEVLPVTLTRVQDGSVGWCGPEIQRRQALAELARTPQDEAARRRCALTLEEALAWSERQGARFWSLRILLSLEQMARPDQRGSAANRDRLHRLLEEIDEDPVMPELWQARQLLETARS